MSDMIYLTDVALITCVVDSGGADDIIRAVRDVGARGAIVSHGRGWGVRERLGILGVAVEVQKDVVNVLVSSDQQDIVFDAVYRAADLDVPGRGIAYITPLDRMASHVPQAILDKLGLDEGKPQ